MCSITLTFDNKYTVWLVNSGMMYVQELVLLNTNVMLAN